MLQLLQQNAYHILGLDTSANTKDVSRRSKEIEHHLKMGTSSKYDLDIEVSDDLRTLKTVGTAIQKLQNPKKKVQESFFWFQLSDDIDKQAFELARKKDYPNAIRIWQNAAETNTIKSFLYKKNLAILLGVALLKKDNMGYLRDSVALWKDILDSNKFWTQFIKKHEERNSSISREFLLEFKSKSISRLSDFYTDLHEFHKNSEYINEFQKVFSIRGEKIQKSVLDPVFHSINTTVENLESMNISEDGILDAEEKSQLKKHITDLQKELNKLIEKGLYEDGQTKVMRDRAAEAIRTIVLDLHNNLSETDKSISLMKIAQNIVGTAGSEAKVQQDLKILEGIKRNESLIKPIADLIDTAKYEEALELIEKERIKYKEDTELQEVYNNQKKLSISSLAIKKYKKAREKFEGSQKVLAKSLFKEIGELIYENLDLYSFNEEYIDSTLADIKSNLTKANSKNLAQFDDYRDSFVQDAKKHFEGHLEETVFIVLIDSYIWGGLVDTMESIRKTSDVVNILNILGWLTVWFYGIGFVFFIAGWIYKERN